MLPVLILADQSAQLLGFILHNINGVLQRADLHLGGKKRQHVQLKIIKKEKVSVSFLSSLKSVATEGDFKNLKRAKPPPPEGRYVKYEMIEND